MISRGTLLPPAEHIPERRRLLTIVHLLQSPCKRKIHAHEPGTVQFVAITPLPLPEVALPLLHDEIREA